MSTAVIVIDAPAKLNLILAILGRRRDGYHQILTLLQSVDLSDQLEFSFRQAKNFQISLGKINGTTDGDFPLDRSNLICRAAEQFIDRLADRPKMAVSVRIKKNIPIGAGLAGGSANAAATLLALNHHLKQVFSLPQLLEIASSLGADVPFSLTGGKSVGKGKGDELEDVAVDADLHFVIVKPRHLSVASSWAYSTFDQVSNLPADPINDGNLNNAQQLRVRQALSHLADGSIELACQMFGNDLESIVFKSHSILNEIKEWLLEQGCLAAHMTGSGSAIYGVLKNRNEGDNILKALTAKKPRWNDQDEFEADAWLGRSLRHGVKVIDEK